MAMQSSRLPKIDNKSLDAFEILAADGLVQADTSNPPPNVSPFPRTPSRRTQAYASRLLRR